MLRAVDLHKCKQVPLLAGNPPPKATQAARGSRGALVLFGNAARLLGIFHPCARLSVSLDNPFLLLHEKKISNRCKQALKNTGLK